MLKIPKVHMDNSYEVGDGVAFKGFINACRLSPQAPVIFSKHYYTPLLTVRTLTFENDATFLTSSSMMSTGAQHRCQL